MEEFDRRGVTPRIDSPNHVPAPISVTTPAIDFGRLREVGRGLTDEGLIPRLRLCEVVLAALHRRGSRPKRSP